jgi:purine-nucleoside/S-methyl-5'-thioadenosine phosphorylase / adenosine deaminase
MSAAVGQAFALEQAFPLSGGRVARVRYTTVSDGDLAVIHPGPTLEARRRALSGRPWSYLHQVHGADVVEVTRPGEWAGADADAAVTTESDTLLAVHTADCAPIALVSTEGVVGAVHAGWRGLAAGVVDAAVERMRALGARSIEAVLGPSIHAECYEFGADDLDRVVERCGEVARGVTAGGRPALDLPAAVRAALDRAGATAVEGEAPCTACDRRFFSHRARGDTGRQALLVWIEDG